MYYLEDKIKVEGFGEQTQIFSNWIIIRIFYTVSRTDCQK
jgi:hypothetical protein